MMCAEIPVDRESARQRAIHIMDHPEEYAVCCGCEGIARREVAICPRCSAYRWEESRDVVRARAKRIMQRRLSEYLL